MKRARLIRRRKTVGLSQEVLAEQLGVDRSTIFRWEHGDTTPQPWQRPNLATALQITVEELAALLDNHDAKPPDQPDIASVPGQPVDAEIVMSARIHYEKMYRSAGGIVVQPLVEAFLHHRVLPAVQASRDNAAGQRLRQANASLTAIAGICAYDAERHRAAEQHFRDALGLAQSAQDAPVAGYITALVANQALCLGRYRTAARIIIACFEDGRGHLSPALQTDLHSMLAKAYAATGTPADCRRHMQTAERLAQSINRTDEPAETSYVHPGLMELKGAESLLKIGETRPAQDLAEASLAVSPPDDPRGRYYSHATLAMILCQRRNLDEALARANSALACAHGMESQRIRDHIGRLTSAFLPFGDEPQVQDLLDQARHLLAVTI